MPSNVILPESSTLSVRTSDSSWTYEVRPSHQLPTLDLSVTLKSHFLSIAARQRLDRWMRRWGVLTLMAYGCTTLIYIVAMVTPPRLGQVLAAVGLVFGAPGTLFVLSALRYDTILVLLWTYDFVFFDSIVVSTLVVLMIMLRDARILIILQSLVAYQVNIFIDANIQALRRVAIVNSYAMLMTIFVGGCVALDLIPGLKPFTLFQYGSHNLNARSFVTDGFITIVAIMLRNTYRKKALLLNRSKGAVVECVSYRCHLTIQPIALTSSGPTTEARGSPPPSPPPPPAHIQTMRYGASLPRIDARCVLIPPVFSWLVDPAMCRIKGLLFQLLGITAAVLVIGVGLYEFIAFEKRGDAWEHDATREQHVHVTVSLAVSFTGLYILACCSMYQRQLLYAIVSSFDFIFLSTQLTFVHIAIADFFQWNDLCLLLVTTWLWSHWVFCVDALTPVVRNRIGLSPIFTRVVMSALVISTGILNHLLIFSESSASLYDRVLWSGTVLNRPVEFRMMASFYSAYVTVLAWVLRFLWRVFTAKRDEFISIDGAVAYDNYLRQPVKKPKSHFSVSSLSAPHIPNVRLFASVPRASSPTTDATSDVPRSHLERRNSQSSRGP